MNHIKKESIDSIKTTIETSIKTRNVTSPSAYQSITIQLTGDASTSDERWISILTINLFVIGNTIQSIIYKILALEHKITLMEYTLLRNLAILVIAIVVLIVKNIEPFEAVPSDKRLIMLGRVFFGFSVSLLISEALELIPFSLLVILF